MGGSSAVMLLNRTSAVMLLNRTGGVVWALKPPLVSCTNNHLCIYDLYCPVHNAFHAGSIHYEGKWEGGWALEIKTFLGPVKSHRAYRRVPFRPKKLTYVFFAELVERLDELLVGVLQDEAHLRLHGGEEQGELLQRAGDNHLIVCQCRSYNIF